MQFDLTSNPRFRQPISLRAKGSGQNARACWTGEVIRLTATTESTANFSELSKTLFSLYLGALASDSMEWTRHAARYGIPNALAAVGQGSPSSPASGPGP